MKGYIDSGRCPKEKHDDKCIVSCTYLQDYLVNYLGAKCQTRSASEKEPEWFKPGDVAIFPTPKHAVFAVGYYNQHLVYDDHFSGGDHCGIRLNDESKVVCKDENINVFFNRGWEYCTYYHIPGQPSPNQPPTVTITSPADGTTFTQGDQITFRGSATDPENGALCLVWTSSIDGQIGTGESFTKSDLLVGTHTITLTATDSQGAKGTASVTITVEAKISAPPVICDRVATLKGCPGLKGRVTSVAFSPDGKLLASAATCFNHPRDDRVVLWNVKRKEPITTLHYGREGPYTISFSPDGRLLAAGTWKGVDLWDVEKRQRIATLHHDNAVYSVSFSPDGKLLATGSSDKMIDIWDVRKRERILTLIGDKSKTKTPNSVIVCFSPDGKLLASGSYDIKLWDVEKRKCIATLTQHAGAVNSIAFSPDGRLLAAGAWEGEVQLWDVEKKERVATLHHEYQAENQSFIYSVAFSPDGRLLASTFQEEVDLWDVEKKERVATLTGHAGIVESVAFSPDGSFLAGGAWGPTIWGIPILLWRVHKGTGGEIHVPEDYPTIQEAIYAANEGATIYVEAGSYLDNLVIDKGLTLRGAGWEQTRIKAYYGGLGSTWSESRRNGLSR